MTPDTPVGAPGPAAASPLLADGAWPDFAAIQPGHVGPALDSFVDLTGRAPRIDAFLARQGLGADPRTARGSGVGSA